MSYYNSYYADRDTFSYSTSITKDDPAFNFMKAQSNKSGTIRTLLNDAVKFCHDLEDYETLSEATRLRKYFNYTPKPDPSEVRQTMLATIDKAMASDAVMQRMTVINRHTHLWRKYANRLVPKPYRNHAMGFIVHSADAVVSGNDADAPEIAFAVAIKDFLVACASGQVDAQITAPSRLEREFITIARVMYDVWDIQADDDMKLTRFTPSYAKMARQVLPFLRDYYEASYGVTTDSLEMVCLNRIGGSQGFTPKKALDAKAGGKERDGHAEH